MKNTSVIKLVSASAISLLMGLVFSGNASAAFISCTGTGYDISTKVSTTTACTILAPLDGAANDVPQPGFVNGAGFFGITDWLFDGKWEGTNSGFVDNGVDYFNFTGGSQSGTYAYVGPASLSDFMFVFKDGGDTNLVGYRLGATSGTYSTPFTEPPFSFPGDNARDISHISVYYRQGGGTPPQGVPEPGVILLMGAGLMGLALARCRKSA